MQLSDSEHQILYKYTRRLFKYAYSIIQQLNRILRFEDEDLNASSDELHVYESDSD